jgi:FAD/FMN-containing dehydrogenase/Fe-S oxidoreductase
MPIQAAASQSSGRRKHAIPMIPVLDTIAAPDALHDAFLAALAGTGCRADVSVTEADRAVFATDNSIYRLPPKAVLFPRDAADVATILGLAAEERFQAIVVTARGGGTGTNGQSLTAGIVLDLSRHMNRILEINVTERWARVEAGVVKDQLNAALAPHGLFFAPELSTSNRATIGGMVNTDASGQGSCLYGKTRDHVLELASVFSDGTAWRSKPIDSETQLREIEARDDIVGRVHRVVNGIDRDHAAEIEAGFPKLNRCLTGYDLAHIRDKGGRFDLNAVLCGAEGTLAVVTEARINVLQIPAASALVNVRYDSFDAALRDARHLMTLGAASIETVDSKVLGLARQDMVWDGIKEFFPDQPGETIRGINLIEAIGTSEAEMEAALNRILAALDEIGSAPGRLGRTIARGPAVGRIWTMRKRAVGLLGNTQGEKRPIPFVEDTAVPPEHLADYIAEFRALLDGHCLEYGMFGHVDAGVLHVRPAIDMKDPAQATLIREISDGVVALTRKYGGLLWGEHGKGIRSEYSPEVFGTLYPLVQAVKAAFDPHNKLNPGKIATPGTGALLRVDGVPTRGEAMRAVPEAVRAEYESAVHCNGNGACYNYDPDDAMCPSWKGLRERRHSPKGRATLVQDWLRRLALAGADPLAEAEALRARPLWRSLPAGLWQSVFARPAAPGDFSHAVKEAMDGCLACKSCVSGCPIKVNVPSFRAKFLELYHGRYPRPLKDYLVASLEHMLPVAAKAAGLYNALAGSALGRRAVRGLGLVDLPQLSGIDLARAAKTRGIGLATPAALAALGESGRAQAVILVQDAFTSHYETGLVLDVLDLLKRLGFTPFLAPYRPNGKALHVHGFLGGFARVARRNLALLKDLAASGVPLIGIEPSVTLTFREEYPELDGVGPVPKILLVQEFLSARIAAAAPALGEDAPRYGLLAHCTERAVAPSASADWKTVFAAHGLRLDILAAGCCGMAGTYGHEAHNYETSSRIFDLSWRGHLERETPGHLVATGYSCRSQAKRLANQAPRHPAQVLLAALRA